MKNHIAKSFRSGIRMAKPAALQPNVFCSSYDKTVARSRKHGNLWVMSMVSKRVAESVAGGSPALPGELRVSPAGNGAPAFTERPAWSGVGDGWKHIHGNVNTAGVSFEWHDFKTSAEFDWGKSFHPNSVEICLNLAGNGKVNFKNTEAVFTPLTVGFYRRGEQELQATRQTNEQHRFLTVEMSFDFLQRHLSQFVTSLHPLVRDVVSGRSKESAISPVTRLTNRHQQLLASLRQAPVLALAQSLWYQAKAMELAAEFFFVAPGNGELFCRRQQRLATERVEKVIALLRDKLAEPPTLEEIGRAVGCSPFHLSRSFSATTGLTISQYLRQLRMERAAELLRSGEFNVTEAALEVGYSSLSHFSQTFHETFGCCPGLYPLRTPAQQSPEQKEE